MKASITSQNFGSWKKTLKFIPCFLSLHVLQFFIYSEYSKMEQMNKELSKFLVFYSYNSVSHHLSFEKIALHKPDSRTRYISMILELGYISLILVLGYICLILERLHKPDSRTRLRKSDSRTRLHKSDCSTRLHKPDPRTRLHLELGYVSLIVVLGYISLILELGYIQNQAI